MTVIECTTVEDDRYPAGLFLASSLWLVLENDKEAKISIFSVCRFWDGVKIEGLFKKRRFYVEINYAADCVVLLIVRAKRSLFEIRKYREKYESELAEQLRTYITGAGGRKCNIRS